MGVKEAAAQSGLSASRKEGLGKMGEGKTAKYNPSYCKNNAAVVAVQTSHKGRYCGLWQRCPASYRKTLGIFQAKIRWSLQAKHTSRQVVRPVCSLLESVGVRVEIQWGGHYTVSWRSVTLNCVVSIVAD